VGSEMCIRDRMADDHRHVTGRRGETPQRVEVGGHEVRPMDQVLGRVAGQGQFGGEEDVRPERGRLLHRVEDALAVAVYVTHHDVDLGAGDPESHVRHVTRPSRK